MQPLGLKAQEEFLIEVLGPALWAATGDDLYALNRFFEVNGNSLRTKSTRSWKSGVANEMTGLTILKRNG